MARVRPDEVLIALPNGSPRVVREVVRALEPYKVPIKTLPALRGRFNGQSTVQDIRDLSVEDLLSRPPIGLDPCRVRELVAGRSVMVTGAGGSIGSELCRQLADCQPERLVLFERYENGLYAIEEDLRRRNQSRGVHPVIGDITDEARVRAAMATHRPDVVFHAAAHKHVPMMEWNPGEAIRNNIGGTRIVAEAADRAGVERFILLSTDKAVNPTSVMGATKLAAERLVQSMAAHSRTRFVTVRFGNVLGSNGSVVPKFLEQIRRGGPVTVTDPEMKRFFMLIPEAVQLVLQAAALGESGMVYVLDMGDQIKLVDMARNLIRLAGFVPEQDIKITFVGTRPGEKLYEELLTGDEAAEASGVDKIWRVRPNAASSGNGLIAAMKRLEAAATSGDGHDLPGQLSEILPSFQPAGRHVLVGSSPR